MPKTLKYSLIVFVGGCAYGVMVPLVRSAFAAGFDTVHVLITQYLFASIFLGIIVVLFSRKRIDAKSVLKLLAVGLLSAGVSFCYYHALNRLPAATAVTLLFQFAWMGVVFQAIAERKLPSKITVLSVLIIMAGTPLAAGTFGVELGSLDPLGVLLGALSAVFYALFLLAGGKVVAQQPALNRTFFTVLGSLIVASALAPGYYTEGVLMQGIAPIGIPLAVLGIMCPIVLITTGAPHLPGGLVNIMASGELPSGIIMAALFLGDPITPAIAAGVGIILAGIVLSQLTGIRKALTKEQGQ
jgi:drug/metabolite transporter (DMT)-like permease